MRFAQGGALERFARFGDAARQRDLAAMTSQRVGPDRQHDVGVGFDREQQQQSGRMTDVRRIEFRRPVASRVRRHQRVRLRPGQRLRQADSEPFERGLELHGGGTTLICGQLPRGGGYAAVGRGEHDLGRR